MAKDRETRIPELAGAGLLDGQVHYISAGEPDALQDALTAAEYILRYVGGTVQLVAVRVPIDPERAPDAAITVEYGFRWNPYEVKHPYVELPDDANPEVEQESNGHVEAEAEELAAAEVQ
jgi:hypothetical protein